MKGQSASTKKLKVGLHRVVAYEVAEVAYFFIALRGGQRLFRRI